MSGFNVYPREIESVIAAAPGVAEVAVVGVTHPTRARAVKAIVVPSDGVDLQSEDVLQYAQQHLARFKAPTIVEVVRQLPHSVTGKIMKSGLKEPAADAQSISDISDQLKAEQVVQEEAAVPASEDAPPKTPTRPKASAP